MSQEEIEIVPGQLKKIITTPGKGEAKPQAGANVVVHYTGTLASDGSKFDSSRDRGEHFKFVLGKGQVIKGWDEGVATMKRGERCTLICSPDYAYGASGSPPKIPGGATLHFDVELFSWLGDDETDVSAASDGSVILKTTNKGDGFETPDFDTKMVVSYKMSYSEAMDQVFKQEDNAEIASGCMHLPEEFDVALQKCKKESQGKITAEAIGSGAKFGIDAGKAVYIEFTLHSFEKLSPWSVEGAAKVEHAEAYKARGTDAFKASNTVLAQRCWKRGLEFVEGDYGMEDIKDAAVAVRNLLRMNLCVLDIRQKNWSGVIEICDKTLKDQANNTKALLRKGKALIETDEWQAARTTLQQVTTVPDAPEAADANKELARLTKLESQHQAKEKALFKKMFA